jgi:hypothetical protein
MRDSFSNSRSFGRACRAFACHCWVKCIVLSFSFLTVGESRVCPVNTRVGMSHSAEQLRVICELNRLVREFVRDPQTLGGRGLFKIKSMHELSNNIAAAPTDESVVGGRVDFVPLIADRTPFSKTKTSFDASPFLPAFEAACLLEPRLLEENTGASNASASPLSRGSGLDDGGRRTTRLLRPDHDGASTVDDCDDDYEGEQEEAVPRRESLGVHRGRRLDESSRGECRYEVGQRETFLRRGGMLAADAELVKLARQWDDHGKLVLFGVDECNYDEASNLLAVYKDSDKDRLIMDRRSRNAKEAALGSC